MIDYLQLLIHAFFINNHLGYVEYVILPVLFFPGNITNGNLTYTRNRYLFYFILILYFLSLIC